MGAGTSMDRFRFFLPLLLALSIFQQNSASASGARAIAIVWKSAPRAGECLVRGGRLEQLKITRGEGKIDGHRFTFESGGPTRLELSVGGRAWSPVPAAPRSVSTPPIILLPFSCAT